MRIRVLGSAAGGGLPQWNCGCERCVRARAGDPAVPPRTQPSIAVSADGVRWSIVNASPDVRDQLARFPALHPRPGTRDIPLDTILVTNADVDHVLGLLVLRESLPYRIVSTPFVRDALQGHNALFHLLEPAWGIAKLDQPVMLDRDGHLEARFFPVPGKVPTWLAKLASNQPETTVGVRITDLRSGRRLVYAPGVAKLDAGTLAEFEAASCSFVDGTFFRNDELSAMRPGAPDATAMGHVPISGPGGSFPILAELRGRVVYIHINNTNPILDTNSPEASLVLRAGIEIAMDGMEVEI
ncbi:MAG: pyrroloquinoline quinone biosynthesis protein PqqB [Deltaproteobacteria bacterium]|nr:pyrroloquinoline quinone biosynthesis protein PqqB [Deltaproteobacteria bacterium]